MTSPSVFGTWQLTSVSDGFPRIGDFSQDVPISAFLVGNESEEFIIRQSFVEGTPIEEILLSYRSVMKTQITRAYQLGKWNIEKYGKEVIGSTLIAAAPFDSDDSFAPPTSCKSFIILRYGYLYRIESSERYSLNIDGSALCIEIEVNYGGVHTSMVKYLRRKTTFEALPMTLFTRTCGWLREVSRSAHTLRGIQVQYVQSYFVSSPSGIDISGLNSPEIKTLAITRRIGDQITDGTNVAVYVFLVKSGSKSWHIVHRYKEFDALRLFINSRKQPLPQRYWNDAGDEPPFPGKRAFSLKINTKASETRAQQLLEYLMYHVSRGGHDIPAIIDTLCSFLEVPEHLFEQAPKISAKETPKPIALSAPIPEPVAIIPSAKPPESTPKSPDSDKQIPIGLLPKSSSMLTEHTSNQSPVGPFNRRGSTGGATGILSIGEYKEPAHYNDFANVSSIIPIPSPVSDISPKDALLTVLSVGIIVIKHGRQGKPQRKLIRCDPNVTRIFWQDEPSSRIIEKAKAEKSINLAFPDMMKSIPLEQVYSIRRGTEYDYTSTDGKKEIGTTVLRRSKLSLAELELCLSMISFDRSYDIQCLKRADFDFLFCNLKKFLNK